MTKNKGLYPALIERLGEMVKVNVELEQRVHQLMDERNRVVRKLNAKDDADGNDGKNVLEQMRKMRDLCDSLEKEREQLKEQLKQLQIERNVARTHAGGCDHAQADLRRQIKRLATSDLVRCGDICSRHSFPPYSERYAKAGSDVCYSCRHNVDTKAFQGDRFVLCAYAYDMEEEEQPDEQPSDTD